MLLLVPVVLLFGVALSQPIHDPDIGWHLRNGQWIWEHRAVPHTDHFSFTAHGRPWVSQEWLWDLLAYGLWTSTGPLGLLLYRAITVGLVYGLLFVACRTRCRHDAVAIAVAFASMLAFAGSWSERPQMLTYGFSILTLMELNSADATNARRLWALVPLTLVWSNLHAGYFLVIVFLGAYTVRAWVVGSANRRTLALVSVGCVLAALVNPNGTQTLIYPLWIMFRPPEVVHSTTEWMSPFALPGTSLVFEGLLLASIATYAVTRTRLRWFDLLMSLAFVHLALTSARNVPLFALVNAPILAEQIGGLLPRARMDDESRSSPLMRMVIVIASLIVAFVLGPRKLNALVKPDPSDRAIHFLSTHAVDSRLFAHYDEGGRLIWKLYPGYRVFIDGRADFYGNKVFADYTAVITGRSGWDRTLDEYEVDTMLCSAKGPLSQLLAQSRKWKRAYADSEAQVFVRRR